jgi:hypothetical protein
MFKRAQRAPESTHDPAAAQVSKGKSLKQSPLQGRTCEATRLSVKCSLSGVPLLPDQTNDSSNFDRFDVSIKFKVLFGIIFNKKEKPALQASCISLHWSATYWMKTKHFLFREEAQELFFPAESGMCPESVANGCFSVNAGD